MYIRKSYKIHENFYIQKPPYITFLLAQEPL